jgi:hypothetical protein
LLLVGLVGCYSPTVHPGAPCGAGSACPGDLVCAADQTCQPPGGSTDGGADASSSADAPSGTDGCATCIAPANDLPADAIDITAGGDFTADLTYAHDDAQRPANGNLCGGDGGLDVFYTIHLDAPEVFYFDTFGSDFDTVMRVVRGSACTGGVAPNGTSCRNDACSTLQSQYATSLPAGDSCLIIDGLDAAQTGHALHLHVERGLIDGSRLPTAGGSVTGDTTNDSDHGDGSCAMHQAADHGWFLTSCPGQTQTVVASTCNQVTATAAWDAAIWSRGPAGELACMDDDGAACALSGGLATISFTVSDAHLFWIVVDSGSPGSAGAYQLDVTFQ